jgi:hypothetical protein
MGSFGDRHELYLSQIFCSVNAAGDSLQVDGYFNLNPTGRLLMLEGLLATLMFSGCMVGVASPVVSPIVVLILLASATLRSKVSPFFRVAIMTGLLFLGSYGAVTGQIK